MNAIPNLLDEGGRDEVKRDEVARDHRANVTGGTVVTVACSARLHLGFFDLNGGVGRRFGSIGLSLDQPVTHLAIRRATTTTISGAEADRVGAYLSRMCRHLELSDRHAIDVMQAIPAHSGLGSGTQLALAVATALRRLHGFSADLRGDAQLLGRGARSGIGIGLFRHGGLVVDGGKGAAEALPPILARASVPSAWRILLVLDRNREGLSGASERAAFESLPPMNASMSGAICRLVLMQTLPALAERDLPAFGAAVSAIQEHVGDYFAPSQGGRFTSPAVAAALRTLAAAGGTGIGQSSWGPTGFAFAADATAMRRLVAAVEADQAARGLDLMVCRALNRGALVHMR